MWSEKKGATYDATVILDGTVGKHTYFKLDFSKKEERTDGKNRALEHLLEVRAMVSTTFPMAGSFPLWATAPVPLLFRLMPGIWKGHPSAAD